MRLSSGRIIWPEHHWLSADNLVGRTLLVAVGACQWTQLVFAARVLLLTLVILFDCPLSRDSHPVRGVQHPPGPRNHIAHNDGGLMTTSTVSSHADVEDRQAIGERARENTPISAQADWEPVAGRPDPVELLIEQNATREADLVPVRHGRMTVSPFTFYRGAAKLMASDLATTPMAGLVVQLCGDAHLSNFGGFASPERQLLFGLNDFDETLPGPFEYDLKRMAASFTIAARNNGFTPADARAVTIESVKAYRSGMADFAAMHTLDIWYAHMTEHDIQDAIRAVQETSVPQDAERQAGKKNKTGKKQRASKAGKDAALVAEAAKRGNKTLRKAHTRDSLGALAKFAEVVDGRHRIVSRPPVIVPLRDLAASYEMTPDEARNTVEEQFRAYKATLSNNRRQLLDRFTIVDMARKVVGVGSVGTRAFMVLLQGRDERRPPVPPGQGGHQLRPRGPSAQEPLRHPRAAGGGRSAVDAGGLRHLPRLDQGRPSRPVLLLAPTARHERLCGG